MRICFGLHTIITHPYPKNKSTSIISRLPPKSCTYNNTMSLVSSSPHENMLRPPHPHHSSLSKKLAFYFIKSTSNISSITAKILYIQTTNCSSSPHQSSRQIPPKSCTYNNTMRLVSSSPHENMLPPHTLITHPYPKTDILLHQVHIKHLIDYRQNLVHTTTNWV